MGAYTEHWERHKKRSVRGVLYALLVIAVGVPSAAVVGMLLEPLDSIDTCVLIALLVGSLIAFTIILIRFSKVLCPRCQTEYSRGKFVTNCPKCGLRMLQENP